MRSSAFHHSREGTSSSTPIGDGNPKISVLFIDASLNYGGGMNQNMLSREHLDKILATYQARENVDKYAYLASLEEIQENDFNLNIPRYVDTFEEEEEIDLLAVRAQRSRIITNLKEIEEQMNKYLEELGYAS